MSFNRLVLWTTLGIAIYCLAHWVWYLGTPLGQSPALDGQENLLLAKEIATGELANEPFFRAMFYPALLALFSKLFPNLIILASLIGLLSHLANATLVMLIAKRIWRNNLSAVLAGIFTGANPVLIHFASDPLDITIATTFSLLALFFFTAKSESRTWKPFALSGLFLALACLARPHFFAVAITGISVLLALAIAKRFPRQKTVAFIGGLAGPCLIYATINLAIGGTFSVLPWQGAYNLWVSNKPGANGLYFTQSLSFHYTTEHQNPNRLESEELYRIETGNVGTIDERNSYWRNKTINSIIDAPGNWIRHMIWKSYAFLNNWEQYNNKTFAFHKARSPALRFNPIGWGLIFSLGLCGGVYLWKKDRSIAITLSVLILSFSAGVILYMASGRFRAPIVPFLAMLAGGAPLTVVALTDIRQRIAYSGLLILGLIISFSSFNDVRSRKTYLQDYMLLADVSAKLGQDRDAFNWASSAINEDASRDDAKRIQLISYYNLVTTGKKKEADASWQDFFGFVDEADFPDPAFQLVKGVTLLKMGSVDYAFATWANAYTKFGADASASLALGLILNPEMPVPEIPESLLEETRRGRHGLLAYALIARGLGPRINLHMTADRTRILKQSLDAVFLN